MGCISCSQEVLYIITVALFFKKQISYFILRLSLNFKKQRNKKQIKAIGGTPMNGFFQKNRSRSQIFKKKQNKVENQKKHFIPLLIFVI